MLLKDLFEIHNGLAATSLKISESKTTDCRIPFIRPSQTWKNLIVGYLNKGEINDKYVFEENSLMVSTNGEGSHSYSYVVPFEFIPNSDVSVLLPKRPMNIKEKVFYSMCITKNRYKFSYGRKPKGNRLGNIILPDYPPNWIKDTEIPNYDLEFIYDDSNKVETTDLTRLSDIFEIGYGNSIELNRLEERTDRNIDTINFVSRTSRNNGISAIVTRLETIPPFPKGLITVAVSGSVLESFLQLEPFYTGYHVMVLKPKKEMSIAAKLFYCMCIKNNNYRYSYGRQANRTLKDLRVPSKVPNWINNKDIDLIVEKY